jgi:REP element-mobilizing transposase RayT
LIEVNGEADHVHLLLELPPTAALAGFALKTGTSRRFARFSKECLDGHTTAVQKSNNQRSQCTALRAAYVYEFT